MNDLSTRVPNGWAAVRLGDIAEINMGQSPPGSSYTSDPSLGTPFLQGNAEFGDRYPTPVKGTTEPRKLANERSVLISVRAPVGDTNFSPGRVAIGRGLAAITPLGGVRREFLFWLLRASRERLEAQGTGTTFKAIPKATLQDMPVLLPPLPEQDRIVEAVESAMAAARRGMEELSKASQLTAALRDGVLEHALPSGTSEVELQECLLEPPRNGRSVPTASSGFPVLRLTAIRDGRVDTREAKTGAWSEEEARPFLIREGDFLVVRGNGSLRLVGRGGLVGTDPERVAYPDTLIRLRTNPERLSGEYLRAVWDSRRVRRQLESQARTTAGIYKINQQMLKTLRIPLPPLDVQQVVARAVKNRLADLDSLTRELEKQSRAARHLEFQLLHQAFTGQLVTQDPADEPASELLKRIEAEKAEREAELKAARRRRRKDRSGSSAETAEALPRPPSQSGKVGTSSD